MREYEKYAKQPSPQMELPGLGSRGEQDMREAREWRECHEREWRLLCTKATWEAKYGSGRVSMRDLVGWLRIEHHVSVKNGLTPALARIMEAEEPMLRGCFTKSKSACDGFAA